MWISYLRQLYSLDTLDTRFTISSTTPPKLPSTTDIAVELPRASASRPPGSRREDGSLQRPDYGAQPSKWRTPEFYAYYFVFVTVVPMMFKVVYDVSKESHPNYPKFAPLLSQGWIPGRKVDNSDGQYASFRDNVPYLFLLVIIHPLLRRAYDYICRADTYTLASSSRLTMGLSSSAAADARLEQRISYDVPFALVLVFVLHGFSAFKIVFLLFVNYKIATALPRRYVLTATWVFNIALLFSNEICRGYPYARLFSTILPSSPASPQGGNVLNLGAWLDKHGGLIPRWEVLFNITVLRLISFNLDYCWSLSQQGASPIEKQLDPSNLSERDRVSIPAKPGDYSFRNYFAYSLYSPLYLAGPILTFNDFISQLRYRPYTVTRSRTILYGIRFLVCLLTMELVIHYIYAVAISKAQPAWEVYTPFQLSMLGYFNLHHIWLKLLLPWRFFRMWALIDGIDPPENMVRCMSDNYSALAFWRGWHRSFNRWVVRYLYIPLGGSGYAGSWGRIRGIANYLAVFTFVALWHDIQLRLLMWGWLITLFVLPEIIATILFPARKWKDRPNSYRVICGIGAVANVLMMMAANLVGFAVGLDGLEGLVKGIVGSYSGVLFLLAASGALFVGVQVMFEVRQHELRHGIRMKC